VRAGRDDDWRRTGPLTRDELAGPLSGCPPFLTADEAARLLRVSKSTLYHHVSRGTFRGAVKPGKPLIFWRDRLVKAWFRPR